MAALKSSSDSSNICVTSVLASVVFSLKFKFLCFLIWQVIFFYLDLDILGIMLWNSGSYFRSPTAGFL